MLKKLNKMVLMTALLITLFMCVFNSTEVKAESYNNGVYETMAAKKCSMIASESSSGVSRISLELWTESISVAAMFSGLF